MRRLGLIALLLGSAGCWMVLGLDDLEYTRDDTGCNPATEVAITDVASPYCVDRTEVTNRAYSAWLAKNPDPGSQGDDCAWNDTFLPGVVPAIWDPDLFGGTPACLPGTYDWELETSFGLDWPVRCVDWCDAAAYCAAAGKRLCGKIGAGVLPRASHGSFDDSEWAHACSGPQALSFPYGAAYVAGACTDSSNSSGNPSDVGSRSGCEGGYPGLSDMSGNVAEWIDACTEPAPAAPDTSPASAICHWMGGAYYLPEQGESIDELSCRGWEFNSQYRIRFAQSIGFRCCRDGL